MRCGASNSTWASARAATAFSASARSLPFGGRKPVNAKPRASVSPATHIAASALLAPGTGTAR